MGLTNPSDDEDDGDGDNDGDDDDDDGDDGSQEEEGYFMWPLNKKIHEKPPNGVAKIEMDTEVEVVLPMEGDLIHLRYFYWN